MKTKVSPMEKQSSVGRSSCFQDGSINFICSCQLGFYRCCVYSSFSQLGNSAISVKGKGLTNAKMYVERKDFSKVKV